MESCNDKADFKTTYFYCREGPDDTTTCIGILKGLISQMIYHCDDLVPSCHEKLNAMPELTLTTESTAKSLLELFCRTIPKQFIVIDGLDECKEEQRANVLRILTAIVKACDEISNCGKPRLLCISHKLGDIGRCLAEASSIEIQNANHEDIEAFVFHKMEMLKVKFDLGHEPELTDQLQNFILINANGNFPFQSHANCFEYIPVAYIIHLSIGMFLYAKLVMDNLDDCCDRKTFKEEISSSVFPTGIEEA